MKTTLELPDDLMRQVKVRAASSDRKLKDTVEELIRRGLDASEEGSSNDPIAALKQRLIFHPDGSVSNPDGIGEPDFFKAIEEIRTQSRLEELRDPFD
jgi:plasmid stability protein